MPTFFRKFAHFVAILRHEKIILCAAIKLYALFKKYGTLEVYGIQRFCIFVHVQQLFAIETFAHLLDRIELYLFIHLNNGTPSMPS